MPRRKAKTKKEIESLEKSEIAADGYPFYKVWATKDAKSKNGKKVQIEFEYTDILRDFSRVSMLHDAVALQAKGTDNCLLALKLIGTLVRKGLTIPESIIFDTREGYIQLLPTIIKGKYLFVERGRNGSK